MIRRAEWLNTVVVTGALLCVTLCILKYNKGKSFKLFEIDLPIGSFPMACGAFTLAHIYCTWLFCDACWKAQGPNQDLWNVLTMKGPLIFNGMLPRKELFAIPFPAGVRIPITAMELTDPTTFLFLGSCVAIYLSMTISVEIAGVKPPLSRIIAWTAIIANWIVGSIWSGTATTLWTS